MRARNIKPGFFDNEVLAECEPLARLLFIGLWCIADREGRLEDRPKRIRKEVLGYDNCDCDQLLNQLQRHGFILRYEAQNNQYIQVLNFSKHQYPHCKETASTIPAPGEHSASTMQTPYLHPLNPESGILNPESSILFPDTAAAASDVSAPEAPALAACGEKKTPKTATCPPDFERFWLGYPAERRREKPRALSEWKNAICKATPEEICDSLARYCESREVVEGFAPYPAKWLKQERWSENHEKFEGKPGRIATVYGKPGHETSKSPLIAEGERLAAKYRAQAEAKRPADRIAAT